MVKVRFDIVVFTFIWVFLVVLVNFFIPPFEKEVFKEYDSAGDYAGYPTNEYVTTVTTLAEIETAVENYDGFAIKADTDKIKATNYFISAKGTDTNTGYFKSNSFLIHCRSLMSKENHDRLYIVELEDGNRIAVRMYNRVLDLSEDTAILPIAEYVTYTSSVEALEALDEKYDLTYDNPTTSLMNASGHSFCLTPEISEKRDSIYNVNWGIIMGGIVLYMIISTIAILRANIRARKRTTQQD